MSETASPTLDSLHVFAERFQLTPSRQQQVLEDYLFVRVFKPEMSFDDFLVQYTSLADAESPVLPATALKTHCSDAKAWPVKSRVALLALAIDNVWYLHVNGQTMPVAFIDFLGNVAQAVTAGTFQLPQVSESLKKRKRATAASAKAFVPAHDIRCMYTNERGYDMVGTLKKGFGDSWQFLTDHGELLQDIALGNCKEPDELMPEAPDTSASVTELFVFVEASEWNQHMAVREPLAEVPMGAEIDMRVVPFGPVRLKLSLKNGETGPYVDPQLVDNETGHVLMDGRPHEFSVLGYYLLKYDNAVYKAVVVTDAQEAPHAEGSRKLETSLGDQ